MIDGLHSNGEHATKIPRESLKDIVSHCVQKLNTDKPKMMLGAYTPLAVLELIRLGVDIFDTSYIYLASTNSQGLVFDYNLAAEKRSNHLALDLNDER